MSAKRLADKLSESEKKSLSDHELRFGTSLLAYRARWDRDFGSGLAAIRAKNIAAFEKAYPRHDGAWSVPEDRKLLRALGKEPRREDYLSASKKLGRTEAAIRTRFGTLKVVEAHRRAMP